MIPARIMIILHGGRKENEMRIAAGEGTGKRARRRGQLLCSRTDYPSSSSHRYRFTGTGGARTKSGRVNSREKR